jgi:hypothetical protein
MGFLNAPARHALRDTLSSRSHAILRSRTLSLCLLTAVLLFGAEPGRASAYCRESLESQSTGDCVESPSVPPLYWERGCMSYVFNSQTWKRIPMGESFVRQTFKASYQSWADVQCGSTSKIPFLVSQASGTTETSKSEFLYDVPNESIVVVRTLAEWASLSDHDSHALALTLIWHDKKTGEILDVDMELNGGAGTFTDCEKSKCSGSQIDLQNTVTHEAGHLLGLGHSKAAGSTMQASTTSGPEITKRTLETDDKNGYCSLMLPAGPCNQTSASCTCSEAPVFPSHKSVSNCSCSAPGSQRAAGSGGALGAALACALGLFLRRRFRAS